ncbi:MAG TPA: HEAT repeat domain-containing protein [Anaeromyxobacteraceae bacterium]|nr:HEAT repeat domain-containing protein [Anaeromyxobacteraceae bacterium]
MSASGGDRPWLTPVPSDPGEEFRYQAVLAIDPARPGELGRLVGLLDDPSWRVRMACVERLLSHPSPEAVVPALVEALAAGPGPGARTGAAAALTRLGAPAVPALLARLGGWGPQVRGAAAEILGEIGDRRAEGALAVLLGDADGNVRAAAAEALGKAGGPGAAAALLGALERDDAAARLAALDALERLGAAPSAVRLAELARDRTLRRAAYRLLGFSDDPQVADLLAQGIADPARGCREAALVAVAQQRMRRAEGDLALVAAAVRAAAASPAVADWTSEALHAEDRRAAMGAVTVLGWLGDPARAAAVAEAGEAEELRPAVLEALMAMGRGVGAALQGVLPRLSPPARVTALAALARLGDASTLGPLAQAAASDDDAVRAAAIDALARLGDAAAVEPLAALLDHPDPAVSGQAAAALAERARQDREAVLGRCRPRGQGRVPAATLRLLGEVGDAGDLPLVQRALRDPRPATRAAACHALEALAARGEAVGCSPEVLDALDDPVPGVRAAAAQAVGVISRPGPEAISEEAVRGLAGALHDEEPVVRAAAARALGRARRIEHAPALSALAASPESPPDAAAAAIRALAEMGRAEPGVLARAAAHPDPEVVKEAVAAAARLPARAGADLVLSAAAHPRWDVRRAAARALGSRGEPGLAGAVRRLLESEEDPMVVEALREALQALEGRR